MVLTGWCVCIVQSFTCWLRRDPGQRSNQLLQVLLGCNHLYCAAVQTDWMHEQMHNPVS